LGVSQQKLVDGVWRRWENLIKYVKSILVHVGAYIAFLDTPKWWLIDVVF
jgi:hypothetical protein